MRITVEMLEKHYSDWTPNIAAYIIRAFGAKWPDGVEVTYKMAERAEELGICLGYIVDGVFSLAGRERYSDATRSAEEARQKATARADAAYDEAIARVEETHDKAITLAGREAREAYLRAFVDAANAEEP